METHKLENGSFTIIPNKLLLEIERASEKIGNTGLYKAETTIARETGWTNFGILRAIGKDIKDFPFKVGDRLVFGQYYGVDLNLDGGRFRIMLPKHILGIDK